MKRVRSILALMAMVSLLVALVPALQAGEVDKININKATVQELTGLQKVGKNYAERIVAYREKNGPFQKAEDIMKVRGIGAKTFELNKDRISVE